MGVLMLSELIKDLEDAKGMLQGYGWFPGPGDSLRWWAGYEDRFHIVVTAVLVQMTRWDLVERVFRKLSDLGLTKPESLASLSVGRLEELLKPLNFRRSKARALIEISRLLLRVDLDKLPVDEARRLLLEVKGVGRETADSILLFAYNKPTIPVSRQLRRVAGRYGVKLPENYEAARRLIVEELNHDLYKLKLLHATTTIIARKFCKVKTVKCSECPLNSRCRKAIQEHNIKSP